MRQCTSDGAGRVPCGTGCASSVLMRAYTTLPSRGANCCRGPRLPGTASAVGVLPSIYPPALKLLVPCSPASGRCTSIGGDFVHQLGDPIKCIVAGEVAADVLRPLAILWPGQNGTDRIAYLLNRGATGT